MIQLNTQKIINSPIRCSGRASDGPNSFSPFAVVTVELTPASQSNAEFSIEYDDPECVNQTGQQYPDRKEAEYFISGAARGVKDAATQYESLGIRLCGLQAKIVKLVAHEIDSTEKAFSMAAKNAMAACLMNVEQSKDS